MTLQEISQEMIKDIGRYAVRKEAMVPKLVQVRKHKKKRINKKWKKRYGTKMMYVKQMALVADITVNDVLEFCKEKNLPLPEEFLNKDRE